MDWIDFLLQIDNNVRLETKVDLNDPLPWKIDLSNSVDRTPCATTSHAYWQPRQQTDSQPITVPDRFDVVRGYGQGIHQLPGNETYRDLVS
jgi:hypothetical protein